MKLVPVAVFGELAQVGLQLIKILHGGGCLLGSLYLEVSFVRPSFLDLDCCIPNCP
jgi:hypothetical protein